MLPPLITNRPRKCQIKKNNVKKVSKNEKNGKMKGQKKRSLQKMKNSPPWRVLITTERMKIVRKKN
jgi:hypothetical protein